MLIALHPPLFSFAHKQNVKVVCNSKIVLETLLTKPMLQTGQYCVKTLEGDNHSTLDNVKRQAS